ncbi:amyloid fiber anchoring/assembly protein TapA [Neobacillus sp. NPDC093127]|uniref:amyloid fiber anchoring/assembly protein TapA n=1 Tax=Neobacillus sp. NPDC093127 TaxID=3364296 RepID=UPI00381DD955
MIKIRYTRSRKFGKRNWTGNLVVKLIAIFYISILTISYLTGSTSAYFSDTVQITGMFQAGTWNSPAEQWDKSSLIFSNKDNNQQINSCNPVKVTVSIANTGNDMKGTTEYEVFYIAKGNAKAGSIVGNGIINPLAKGKSGQLTFTASFPGNYKFKAYQRPFHNFKNERKELWSETISITCSAKSNSSTKESEENFENKSRVGVEGENQNILAIQASTFASGTLNLTVDPTTLVNINNFKPDDWTNKTFKLTNKGTLDIKKVKLHTSYTVTKNNGDSISNSLANSFADAIMVDFLVETGDNGKDKVVILTKSLLQLRDMTPDDLAKEFALGNSAGTSYVLTDGIKAGTDPKSPDNFKVKFRFTETDVPQNELQDLKLNLTWKFEGIQEDVQERN